MADLAVLSDVEFEELMADLLAAEYGVHVERFPRGPDGGVDLRWRKPGAADPSIGQCKHYPRSTFAHLKAAARGEIPHLEGLELDAYRFITSMDLTRTQKSEIHTVLARWLDGPDSVLSAGDIDAMLTRQPHIERAHPKLWVSSGAQLFWETHSEIAHRSTALRDRVSNSLPRYVLNKGYEEARALLDKHRVCIIAGLPGIGKTTLAHILVANAMAQGYEPIEVSSDIEEGWTAIQGSELQVFLYDDFLGQLSFSERLGKNEDRRLFDFIAKVASSKTKLLVMTTREYVLLDARRTYDLLDTLDRRMHLVLELEDYTRANRARILYNHLWHADISNDGLTEIAGGGYRRIVDHRNYNPRLVEHATGAAFDTQKSGYVARFVEVLDHPARLWQRAFETHLTDVQRLVAVTLATLPRGAPLDDLQHAHEALCGASAVATSSAEYRAALHVMEGTFISISVREGETLVEFHNPSIREFLLDWIANDRALVERLVRSAVFFEQATRLCAYATSGTDRTSVLQAALLTHADVLHATLERLMMSPSPERTREWSSEDGERYQRPSGWFERRLIALLKMRRPLDPPHEWLETLIPTLTGRWREDLGNKSDSVALMRDVLGAAEIGAPGGGIDVDRAVLDAAEGALDDWLAKNLEDTEEDWLPYLDRLARKGPGLHFENAVASRFEQHAKDEIDRWSPSPPGLDYLVEYAGRFGLGELVEDLEAVVERERKRDDEAAPKRDDSPSPLSTVPSVAVSDSDLDSLFARLVCTGPNRISPRGDVPGR